MPKFRPTPYWTKSRLWDGGCRHVCLFGACFAHEPRARCKVTLSSCPGSDSDTEAVGRAPTSKTSVYGRGKPGFCDLMGSATCRAEDQGDFGQLDPSPMWTGVLRIGSMSVMAIFRQLTLKPYQSLACVPQLRLRGCRVVQNV